MKALIAAILLTLSCNALADDEACLFVSRVVDSVAGGRDKGLSFFDAINLVKDHKEGGFKTIYINAAKDVYDRDYMTRNELAMYWYDKCVKEIK